MEEWKRTPVATCEALVNSRGLRQYWNIMVAAQNIDTLGPIWTFSLKGVLTFVPSGLDINGCVLSYFEGTANFHCYTSCTHTTLHCSKVSILQCCHMKRYNKIFTKMWGVYSLQWDTVCMYFTWISDTHFHTNSQKENKTHFSVSKRCKKLLEFFSSRYHPTFILKKVLCVNSAQQW